MQPEKLSVFLGAEQANDFNLQIILDVIRTIPDKYDAEPLLISINNLLKLSEEVANRNKADLYELTKSNDKSKIFPPNDETIKKISKTLVFTEAQLKNIDVNLHHLEPFIFDPNLKRDLNQQSLGNTSLERFPLIYDGTKVILALPTAVSVSIRRFVFEWVYSNGLTNAFEKNLAGRHIGLLHEIHFFGKYLNLDTTIKPEKVHGAHYLENIIEIRNGRFIHIIIKIDTLDGFFESGFDSVPPYADEQMKEIERRIEKAKETISTNGEIRDGMSLIISCGYGRAYFGMISEKVHDWDVEFISIHDLETSGFIPNADDLFIWHLTKQVKKLAQLGIQFVNASGPLNLYGWLEQNDYVIVPDEVEIGTKPCLINIPTDCLAKIRQKTRKTGGVHSELFINGHYKRVKRKHSSSLFEQDENRPLYVSYFDINFQRLLGCAVSNLRPWWVSLNETNSKLDRDMQFKIWNSLHNWMERISITIDKQLRYQNNTPVLFELDLSKLSKFEYIPDNQSSSTDISIEVEPDKDKNIIKLILKDPFLINLNSPINISETELVRSCISGYYELFDEEINVSKLNELTRIIVPNQDARHIHAFVAINFREIIRSYDQCKYSVINPADAGFIKLGLGNIDGSIGHKEITGKTECTTYLNNIVHSSWEILKTELNRFNRESLILAALRNIEGVAIEKEIWSRSARALLGLHSDHEDVHKGKMKHYASLYATDIACRIIVEMAICECPIDDGLNLDDIDLSMLMARASLIFHLGNTSDAIMKGVSEPKIVVASNGDIKTDFSFMDEIIMPFMKAYEKSSFSDDAKKYDSYFEEKSPAQSPSEVFSNEFLLAFEKEFGVSFENLRSFKEEMENMAIEKKQSVISVNKDEIINYFQSGKLINDKETIKALNEFTLAPRNNWETPPLEYTTRDIYPWLFRRRLSLLQKPFVQLNESDNPKYIISPGLASLALAYTLDVYYDFRMEEKRCRSNEMKNWIGNESRKRGTEFNNIVANVLNSIGYKAIPEVNMSAIVSSEILDKDYGDIDVLAWKDGDQSIYIIECKYLYFAKTTKEIAEQILEFKGEIRNGKPDRLKKHLDRIDILNKNIKNVQSYCGIENNDITLIPYIVFSNPVPMMYDDSTLQKINTISINEIKEKGLNN
jgi:hypothetical protein